MWGRPAGPGGGGRGPKAPSAGVRICAFTCLYARLLLLVRLLSPVPRLCCAQVKGVVVEIGASKFDRCGRRISSTTPLEIRASKFELEKVPGVVVEIGALEIRGCGRRISSTTPSKFERSNFEHFERSNFEATFRAPHPRNSSARNSTLQFRAPHLPPHHTFNLQDLVELQWMGQERERGTRPLKSHIS